MVLAIACVAGTAGFASVAIVVVVQGRMGTIVLSLELLRSVVFPGGLILFAS